MENPVLRRELLLRLRVRSTHRSTRIAVYVLIGIVVISFYWVTLHALFADGSPATYRDSWGLSMGVQLVLICLLAPSIAANAVTQEREQQTWEMLLFTRLTPAEILLGKLFGRLGSLAMILAIFAPITILCGLESAAAGIGRAGVGLFDIVAGYATLFLVALFYTTVGLYLSLRLRRTLYATLAAYVLVIGVLCVGTGLMEWMADTVMTGGATAASTSPLLWLNPIRIIVAVLSLNEPDNQLALSCGLFGYLTGTVALVFLMLTGFRRYSEE